MTNDLDIETLKLCLEQEDRAERSFKLFASLALIVVVLLEIAESQATVEVRFLGHFSSSIIKEKAWFIKGFMTALMVFSLTEWTIALIDTNRHPLYGKFTQRKSSCARLAQWWDKRIRITCLESLALLDAVQNGIFLAMFVLIVGMILGC